MANDFQSNDVTEYEKIKNVILRKCYKYIIKVTNPEKSFLKNVAKRQFPSNSGNIPKI